MSRDLERLCERIDEQTDADTHMTKAGHMGTSGGRVDACEVEHNFGDGSLQIFDNNIDDRNDFYAEHEGLAVTFDNYDVSDHGATQFSLPLRGDPRLYYTHSY